MVLETYAITLPKSRETNAAELPGPEPVGEVSPTDTNFERTDVLVGTPAEIDATNIAELLYALLKEAGGPSTVDENISSIRLLINIVYTSSLSHSTELSLTLSSLLDLSIAAPSSATESSSADGVPASCRGRNASRGLADITAPNDGDVDDCRLNVGILSGRLLSSRVKPSVSSSRISRIAIKSVRDANNC